MQAAPGADGGEGSGALWADAFIVELQVAQAMIRCEAWGDERHAAIAKALVAEAKSPQTSVRLKHLREGGEDGVGQ